MLKKLIISLGVVLLLSFTSCGGGSSKEARERLNKILQFIGIPHSIIVNVCQDSNRDGICGAKELFTKLVIKKGESVDDILQKISLTADGRYFLNNVDPNVPILVEIEDQNNIQHDGGRLAMKFNGFKTNEQNETKEISALQLLEDSGHLTAEETKKLKETPNREIIDSVIFESLENNYNLLRDEELNTKVATNKGLEVLANELKKVDVADALPKKIVTCEDNATCIKELVTTTSQELNITKEEAEVIAEEVKRDSRHIADGYIIKLNSPIEAQCSGGVFYQSSLNMGEKGEVFFNDANLSNNCKLIVPSDAIIDSNNNGKYDNSDKAIGFVMKGDADGTFVTPLTTLLLSKKSKGEDTQAFKIMVKNFNPVSSASAVGLYTGEKKNKTQKLILLMEILKTAMKEGADISAIDLTQILSNISFKDMDIGKLMGGLSGDIQDKILNSLKASGIQDLVGLLDKFDTSKVNLNTLMVNVSDGGKNLNSAIESASKVPLPTDSNPLDEVVKPDVDVKDEFGEIMPTPTPVPTVMPTPTPVPTVMPTPTPIPTVMPTPTPSPTITPTPTPSPTSTPTPTARKGYLIDSPMFGVNYICDGVESLTDSNGMFECIAPPVTFKIGNLTLGKINTFTLDSRVYPQDFLGIDRTNYSSDRLKLLAQLLQSLDDDGYIETRITITDEIRNEFTVEQNFKDMSESDIQTLLSGIGKNLLNECGALEHLGANISCDSNGNYHNIPILSNIDKNSYLKAINDARGMTQDCHSKGIFQATSPLSWNDKLYKAAYEHTQDLAETDTFSHSGSGTETDWTGLKLGHPSNVEERIENYDYDLHYYAENVAGGTHYDTATIVVQKWLESDVHCANLMNGLYDEVGMAMVYKEGTYYTYYWTQDFGATQ